MTYEKEKLNQKERLVLRKFLSELKIIKRKTKKPVILAMVGLVGSGKKSVAREFAGHIGASIIASDVIRTALRTQNQSYDSVQRIAESIAIEVIKCGGNVIFDSDYINQEKRARLRNNIKSPGTQLLFVRTYCDMDISLGRIVSANYHNAPEEFFRNASSAWHGSKRSVGMVVKIREMWRRTPNHYRWVNGGGGTWKLKKLSFTTFVDIDTASQTLWKSEVKKAIKEILAL